MKKIKVFIYIDSLIIGGMHKQVLYLAQFLNKKKFKVIICTQNSSKGGLSFRFKKSGCTLIDLGRDSTPQSKKGFNLKVSIMLFKRLNKYKPHLILINAAPNLLYYKIAERFLKYPIILVGSFRALTFWKGHMNPIYKLFDDVFAKWLYRSSREVIVNSIALKKHYRFIVKENLNKPIKLIYNGIDSNLKLTKDSNLIRSSLGLKSDDIFIIMVARLDPWKDFKTIFDSIALLNEKQNLAKLFLIGDGPLRSELLKDISKRGLRNKIKLLGEKKDILNFINACDISVLSTHGEGFSNTIVESMMLGKPVIATKVGGNTELIGNDRKCGYLIQKQSAHEFSKAIIKLINNKEKRLKMGLNGKSKISKMCQMDRYISNYDKLFSDLYQLNRTYLNNE